MCFSVAFLVMRQHIAKSERKNTVMHLVVACSQLRRWALSKQVNSFLSIVV